MKPKENKKPALCLGPHESPAKGLRRIALEQIDAARGALGNGEDPARAVHEARKSLKKLRAVFRLIQGEFGRARREEEKAALRDIARALGPMRDAVVLLRTFDTLIETAPAQPGEFSSVRPALQAENERAEAEGAATVKQVLGQLNAARKRVDSWPVDDLRPGDLKAVVRRTYARGRKALAAYRAKPGPETFHDWRKRVKELWYHLRILKEAFHKPEVERRIERLKKLGELAGDAHDLDTLRAAVQRLAGPGVQAAMMIGEIDARVPEFYAEALRRGGRFYKKKPGEFMDGLAGK